MQNSIAKLLTSASQLWGLSYRDVSKLKFSNRIVLTPIYCLSSHTSTTAWNPVSGDQIFSTHAVSSTSSSTASAGDSRLSGFPHPYHGEIQSQLLPSASSFSRSLPTNDNVIQDHMSEMTAMSKSRKQGQQSPVRTQLNRGMLHAGPDPECDKTCANGGWCNYDKICQCLEGYMGQQCTVALCYPKVSVERV